MNIRKGLLFTVLFSGVLYAGAQGIARYTYHDIEKTKLKEIFHVADTFNNVLEGPYLSYHLNGNIESKGQFANNETVGVWEFYYETGNLKMRGALRNNSNYGLWEYFYENGNRQMEGKIINRKREGPWKIYFESGKLKHEGNFLNNMRSGLWKSYYEDGNLKGEVNYKEDRGLCIEYYHTGEWKAQGQKDGVENTGEWKFYYPSGAIQAEGSFVDGKRSGMWTHYFEGGQVSSRGVYENDLPIGKWQYYFESGKLNSEGNFSKDGEKEGAWNSYFPGGSLKSTTLFNGKNGGFSEYYKNGQLKATGNYIDGKKTGPWKYFYENGKLQGEVVFNNGRGTYKGYFPDGTLQTTGLIEDDHRIGTWEIYNESGALKGYFKPFYESDTLDISKMLEKAGEPQKNYGVADYAFGKKKFDYFNAKTNEYRGIVFSLNPFSTLIGEFPVAAELYFEERLGYELIISGIRDPFFVSNENIQYDKVYTRGYTASIRQKFYNPDHSFGMFYFGHALSYSSLKHFNNVEILDSDKLHTENATEDKYIYSLLAGYRFMKNTDRRSFTMDAFISIGTGYRKFTVLSNNPQTFEGLPQKEIPIDFNFGITLGYSYPFY